MIALITGASSGIGEAAARRLAREPGSSLVLVARREERLRALASSLGEHRVSWVAADLVYENAPARILEHVQERHGRLDLLVNNAGSGWRARFADGGYENVRRTMAINFDAPVRLTEALLPLLRASAPSAIVNVASTSSRVARAGAGAYSASKFALAGWSDALWAEERPHGVHVGLVLPGFISTEGFPQTELTEKALTRWAVSTPERPPRRSSRPARPPGGALRPPPLRARGGVSRAHAGTRAPRDGRRRRVGHDHDHQQRGVGIASRALPIVLCPCPLPTSTPRSLTVRPCCASPTTSACVSCCARSRGDGGTPSGGRGASRWIQSRAEALARLLAGLSSTPEVTDELARAIERRRARRRHDECVLDLARPDENWWLSFATDTAPELSQALLEHPDAYRLPAIGRALIPLDEHAARLVEELPAAPSRLRLTDDAAHALTEIRQGPGAAPGRDSLIHDVELRRDRRGEHWIMIAAAHAPLARVLAGRAGLRALDGPDATLALAAVEHDGESIAELISELEVNRIDPRVQSWLARATTWAGTIEVAGHTSRAPTSSPCSCCSVRPNACRESCASRR